MARSLKKGPFIDESLAKKVEKVNASEKKEVQSNFKIVRRINHGNKNI